MEEIKEKKLNILERILFSIIIILGGLIVFFCSFSTSGFIFGSPPKNSFTLLGRIKYNVGISIYISYPISFFILLLLKINTNYNLNLLNYAKCLFFSFIVIFFSLYIRDSK